MDAKNNKKLKRCEKYAKPIKEANEKQIAYLINELHKAVLNKDNKEYDSILIDIYSLIISTVDPSKPSAMICDAVTVQPQEDCIYFLFSDGTVKIIPIREGGKIISFPNYRKPQKVKDLIVGCCISARCPTCHEAVFNGDKFCRHCGQALDWDVPENVTW